MKIQSKQLIGLTSLLLFMAFCASLAYWSTQWLMPKQRALTAPASLPQIDPALAATLFGHAQQTTNVAGNYKLMGIVAANIDADSIAIVSVDSQPARAWHLGAEIQSSVRIKEIHASYIILRVGADERRIALPKEAEHAASDNHR